MGAHGSWGQVLLEDRLSWGNVLGCRPHCIHPKTAPTPTDIAETYTASQWIVHSPVCSLGCLHGSSSCLFRGPPPGRFSRSQRKLETQGLASGPTWGEGTVVVAVAGKGWGQPEELKSGPAPEGARKACQRGQATVTTHTRRPLCVRLVSSHLGLGLGFCPGNETGLCVWGLCAKAAG